MIEFEKWWNNPTNKEINKLYKEDAPRQDWAEAAYRRALKWVLTHRRDIISTEFIEKELENE